MRAWSWGSQGLERTLWDRKLENGTTNPVCVWSPDGRTLAWSPGTWDENRAAADVYLVSDQKTIHILGAHDNGIGSIAFSPGGSHLMTSAIDRSLALYDAKSGASLKVCWKASHRLETSVFHPLAGLIVTGGGSGVKSSTQPGRFYIIRVLEPLELRVIEEHVTDSAVMSVAFSPDGEHLLMGTYDRLSLFRVHLI